MSILGIKFPFKETTSGGIIQGTTTTNEKIRTNLLSLLTTRRRQRVMHNDFFSPIYDYIFEQLDDITRDSLRNSIKDKVKQFIPEITITTIDFQTDEENNLITISIYYTILSLVNSQDSVSITLPITS